jgi:PAS domain S-box-containing protein
VDCETVKEIPFPKGFTQALLKTREFQRKNPKARDVSAVALPERGAFGSRQDGPGALAESVAFAGSQERSACGFFQHEGEIFFVTACHILKSDRSGPFRGWLVFAKSFNSTRVRNLSNVAQMELALLSPESLGGKEGEELTDLTRSGRVITETPDSSLLFIRSLILDLNLNPCFALSIKTGRSLVEEGHKSTQTFLAIILVSGTLISLVLFFTIDRVQRRLQAATDRSERLFQTAPSAIFTVDPQNRITSWNHAAEVLTGHGVEEVLGRTCSLLDCMDCDGTCKLFDHAVPKPLLGRECTLTHKDGSKRYATKNCDLLHNEKGEVIGGIECLIDVTREREAQREQKQLEHKMQRMETMQVIGQLAGGMAHDFNNQLAVILGYAEYLSSNHAEGSQVHKFATKVVDAARRSSALTQQLLAFARRGNVTTVAFDLHTLVEEVISFLRHTIDKRIAIVEEFRIDTAPVSGDPGQLENAILNLALNARDAMQAGGTLTFRSEEIVVKRGDPCLEEADFEIQPGTYMRLSVIDTGCGMPSGVSEHIFEPFFTTKAPGEGTGMGLSSVYGTVKAHGGFILVESQVGVGTTFRVYLPKGTPAGELPVFEAPIDAPKEAHILIIDDEPEVGKICSALLEKLGYRTTVINSSREAVEHFRFSWQDIDLVMLDQIMPEMNGAEVFAALKVINPGTRIVIFSGYTDVEEAHRLLSSGALAFIHKPFDLTVLAREVAQALTVEIEEPSTEDGGGHYEI